MRFTMKDLQISETQQLFSGLVLSCLFFFFFLKKNKNCYKGDSNTTHPCPKLAELQLGMVLPWLNWWLIIHNKLRLCIKWFLIKQLILSFFEIESDQIYHYSYFKIWWNNHILPLDHPQSWLFEHECCPQFLAEVTWLGTSLHPRQTYNNVKPINPFKDHKKACLCVWEREREQCHHLVR